MQGLEEIAVIHSTADYAQALFVKEFLKWSGFSYFDYVYNDLYDKFNENLEKSNNHFDAVFYINDAQEKYESRFGNLTENNIHLFIKYSNINLNDEEKHENNCIWNSETLKRMWKDILKQIYKDENTTNTLRIFDEMSEIYCRYDLFRKLLNNTESVFKQVLEEQGYNAYVKGLKNQKNQWKKACDDLRDYFGTIQNNSIKGIEHLEYAKLYCKRKINGINRLLNEQSQYNISDMVREIHSLYSRNYNNLYMAESMAAKVFEISQDYENIAIPALHNCTHNCKVDACNSSHFYRLGKLYEKYGKKEQAAFIYEKSYTLNPLNFRTVYKLAADCIRKQKYGEAQIWVLNILYILQLDIENVENCKNILCKLPPLELEYASKCYMLLAKIETYKDNRNQDNLNYCYEMAEITNKIIQNNIFVQEVYSDQPLFVKYLKTKLSLNSIKKKIQM